MLCLIVASYIKGYVMLLLCQRSENSLVLASNHRHESIVEFLLFEGNAEYEHVMDHQSVRKVVTKVIMESLDPGLSVKELRAMVVEYLCGV